jgi:hypothetical protein
MADGLLPNKPLGFIRWSTHEGSMLDQDWETSFVANADADDVIARGGSISEIARALGSRRAALDYYSKSCAHAFGPNGVAATCCDCGAEGQTNVLRCTWDGTDHPLYMAPILFFAIVLKIHHFTTRYTWKFITYHAICPPCRNRFLLQRSLAVVMQVTGLTLIGTGAIVAIAWALPALFEIVDIHDPSRVRFWGVIGCLAIAAGAFLLMLRRKIPLPREIAAIRRRPFELMLTIPSKG